MTKTCWLVTRQLAKISSELCYFVSLTSFFSKNHTCVLCEVGRAFQLPPFILGRKKLGRLVSPVLLFPKLAELWFGLGPVSVIRHMFPLSFFPSVCGRVPDKPSSLYSASPRQAVPWGTRVLLWQIIHPPEWVFLILSRDKHC